MSAGGAGRHTVKHLAGIVLALLLATGGLARAASVTEEQKVEEVVAAVVEAYRAGDYEAMGAYYAPEVTMVPGDYGPPVLGWTNVVARYRAAQAGLSSVEMIRDNTRIQVRGKLAWAVYQWRFAAMLGSDPISALGHTTLVLEKRKGRWVIVHNHTSALLPLPAAEKPAAEQPSR